MELRLDIDYKQILGLIYQLPKEDIEKLANVLQFKNLSERTPSSIGLLILDAPTWDNSSVDDYQEARKHINKSRIA